MPVSHEPWLVALSIIVAIQGAYVGLFLAVQVAEAGGLKRRLLLAGAAGSLAVAIWAMHFIGMLAMRLSVPIDYLVFPTLLSFLVCVIVLGAAVFAASAGPLTWMRLAGSACLMGAGIFTMHYIGMMALHASAWMVHDPRYVAASLAVAIGASGLALWLASGKGHHPPIILSATAFGLAISGMHYTAMAGVALFPHEISHSEAPALSSDILAIVVAVVAFAVSGVFLLVLMPDREIPKRAATAVAAAPGREPGVMPAVASVAVAEGPQFGKGSLGPLGGAGAPPRRFAQSLPVERDGVVHFVAIDAVVAVHANAHYTYIFDGAAKLFCPLAIGDVESRLDTNRFFRVHRSHIVNLERVVGLRRSGEGGLVELDSADRYEVPVSRSRVSWLRAKIAAKAK
jgi:NO-binding membrane sensor protein with MHYT domain